MRHLRVKGFCCRRRCHTHWADSQKKNIFNYRKKCMKLYSPIESLALFNKNCIKFKCNLHFAAEMVKADSILRGVCTEVS